MASVSLGPHAETRVNLGLVLLGGACFELGPGEVFAELSATLARLSGDLVAVRTGGLSLLVGYRLDPLRLVR